jgi:hypothetical protein
MWNDLRSINAFVKDKSVGIEKLNILQKSSKWLEHT